MYTPKFYLSIAGVPLHYTKQFKLSMGRLYLS